MLLASLLCVFLGACGFGFWRDLANRMTILAKKYRPNESEKKVIRDIRERIKEINRKDMATEHKFESKLRSLHLKALLLSSVIHEYLKQARDSEAMDRLAEEVLALSA